MVVVTTDSPKRRIAAIAVVGALPPILIIISARPVLSEMYPWEAFGRRSRHGQRRCGYLAGGRPHLRSMPAALSAAGRTSRRSKPRFAVNPQDGLW
jgi:hypothetical protein